MNDLTAMTAGALGATLLLVAMLGASLYGLFVAPAMVERNLFRPFWLLPQRDYATLVTSAFVHADLPHLLFNAFTFWAFGFALERRLGTASFLVLYAFGLLMSDLVTYLTHRRDPQYRTLGASGAILAVLFASIVYFPSNAIFILPIPVPIPAPLFALGYLAFSIYASRRAQGRINHDAHLGGAVAGLLYVAATDWPALQQAWRHVLG